MAISLKGKRKVRVQGRTYAWYVADGSSRDVPEEGFVTHGISSRYLHIISTNKALRVRFRIPRAEDPYSLLLVDGDPLPRQPEATAIQVPRWRHDSKRYPTADFVRRLVGWCLALPS